MGCHCIIVFLLDVMVRLLFDKFLKVNVRAFQTIQNTRWMCINNSSNDNSTKPIISKKLTTRRRLPSRISVSPAQRLNAMLPRQYQVSEPERNNENTDTHNDNMKDVRKEIRNINPTGGSRRSLSAYDRVKSRLGREGQE